MLLGTGARRSYALLMLAPLLLHSFARRDEVVLAADGCCTSCLALVDGGNETLSLRREVRDRAIENASALARLFELGTRGPELRLRVGEQILTARGLRLGVRTRFFQPFELEARVRERLGDLVGAASGSLRALASTA